RRDAEHRAVGVIRAVRAERANSRSRGSGRRGRLCARSRRGGGKEKERHKETAHVALGVGQCGRDGEQSRNTAVSVFGLRSSVFRPYDTPPVPKGFHVGIGPPCRHISPMPSKNGKPDLHTFEHHWQDEADAAYLYRVLASVEPDAAKRDVYQRLAVVEDRHTEIWADVIAKNGGHVGKFSPAGRTRLLAWLGRRFGPGFLLPM